MTLRGMVFAAIVAVVLCLSGPVSAQDVTSSSPAPARQTRSAPAAFLWIPLILVAGSVYAVRVFVRPVSKRDHERS